MTNRLTDRSSKKLWKWNALLILSLVALVALLAPPAEAGDQLRVDVDEPFEFHGQVYEPATVTLRHVNAFTPTSALHEVWVGGKCLGMMVAHSADSERVAEHHAMLFSRNDQNRLVLVGLSYRGEPSMLIHRVGDDLTHRAVRHGEGQLVALTTD